ncbi:MAG TPA: TIGR01777 family oxidoreductase [Opitutaceae bacterium]|nr:TIGR01777 family oxidoreductase [Opitutaceae bacterium]
MKILIAGASGLIGRAASSAFSADGHEVTRLVRRAAAAPDELAWHPAAGELPLEECRKADAVVNLCGVDVSAKRWTTKRRNEIRTSRIDATQTLAKIFIGKGSSPSKRPSVFISASAVGIYGDRGNLELTESSGPGNGFLSDLCRDWEGAALAAAESGARVVCIRLGTVLSREGGLLQKIGPYYRAGLGCQLGSGRQWMSWIALEDAVSALRFTLAEAAVSGPVNFVSPNSVTNAGLTRALGRIFGHQLPMPVPPSVLRLIYGPIADEALLASAHVVPNKLVRAGYPFRYPNLEDALYQALAMEKVES